VKKIVSICPHCVRTIGTDWKEFGEGASGEHQAISGAHWTSSGQNGERRDYRYHDPCYLGRYAAVYDEPRSVIARFGTVVDPPRARERSFCCGAGGGLAFLGGNKGKRVSAERAEELVATGASVVGAACPFCNTCSAMRWPPSRKRRPN